MGIFRSMEFPHNDRNTSVFVCVYSNEPQESILWKVSDKI